MLCTILQAREGEGGEKDAKSAAAPGTALIMMVMMMVMMMMMMMMMMAMRKRRCRWIVFILIKSIFYIQHDMVWHWLNIYFQLFLGGLTLSPAPHRNFHPNDLYHYQEQLPN